MVKVWKKSARRLSGSRVPGTCSRQRVGWRSEFARCPRNWRRHLARLEVKTNGRRFLRNKLVGLRCGSAPTLLVRISDKDKRIFLQRLHITRCGIGLDFLHKSRSLVGRHTLGRLPEFIREKPNPFAVIDFCWMVSYRCHILLLLPQRQI